MADLGFTSQLAQLRAGSQSCRCLPAEGHVEQWIVFCPLQATRLMGGCKSARHDGLSKSPKAQRQASSCHSALQQTHALCSPGRRPTSSNIDHGSRLGGGSWGLLRHISHPRSRAASVASFLTADRASRHPGCFRTGWAGQSTGQYLLHGILPRRLASCWGSRDSRASRASRDGSGGREREQISEGALTSCSIETSTSHAVAEGSGGHAIGCLFPSAKGRPMGAWRQQHGDQRPRRCMSRRPRLCFYLLRGTKAYSVRGKRTGCVSGAGDDNERHQIGKSGPMQDRPTCGQIRIELDGAGQTVQDVQDVQGVQGVQAAWESDLLRAVPAGLSSPPAGGAANGRPRDQLRRLSQGSCRNSSAPCAHASAKETEAETCQGARAPRVAAFRLAPCTVHNSNSPQHQEVMQLSDRFWKAGAETSRISSPLVM